MSINPSEENIRDLTLQVKYLNDQLTRKDENSIGRQIQSGKTTAKETQEKIESCFKTAQSFSGFLEPWSEGRLAVNPKLDRFSKMLIEELKILKTFCKILGLEKGDKNPLIKKYLEEDSLQNIAN